MTIRQKIFEIVQPDRGQSPASRIFDWTITILILLSVVSVFIITFDLPRPFMRSLFIFEQVASAIFTIEYILRLATADLLYPESGAIRARVRYFFSPMALIDLAAILPFWLPMFLPCSMLALRALWLFRLLRIFKLNRYCEALSSVGEVLAERKRELLGSLFSVVLMMLVSSLLMYSAEQVCIASSQKISADIC